MILGLSFLLMAVETWLKGIVSVSGLLAVMSMACVLKIKVRRKSPNVCPPSSASCGSLPKRFFFVLVGAAVDIRCAVQAGAAAVLMIALAIVFRAVGVSICMLGTGLNRKERLFCMIAYLPKATVQAAIGSGAAVNGSAVRTAGAFGGGARHPDYRAARRHWHRPYRRTPSRAGEPVRYCRMRICWVRL